MKKAFTLLEMLIVIAVLVTLMTLVFRIAGVANGSQERQKTITRIQRVENCLSGYYAAFGSYPPVSLHGSRDPFLKVGSHGIQETTRNENIFNWTNIGEENERNAWEQVQSACLAQPVSCNYPFPSGYDQVIDTLSEEMKQLSTSHQSGFECLWQKGDGSGPDDHKVKKFGAGFHAPRNADFGGEKNKTSWKDVQLFRFGLMSYLLPRYLVMMNGDDAFYRDFAQWCDNNELPSDPFNGTKYSSWLQLKNICDNSNPSKKDVARLANIPTQSVCARWMPNLEGICSANRDYTIFGVSIKSYDEDTSLRVTNGDLEVFTPGGAEGYQDQYVLDGISVKDGWGHDLYYYSPAPHQKYVLWSAGPNGRTFPPWISLKRMSAQQNRAIAKWIEDDIHQLRN